MTVYLPGDIIFVEGTRIWDRVIEWATVSPYSHVALVSNGCLVEALEGHGVRETRLDRYAKDRVFVGRPSASPEQVALALNWVQSWVGKGYGWREAWTAGVRDVLHVPLRSRVFSHLDCSGLIASAYAAAGYPLTRAIAPTPADLWASELVREVEL